MPEKSLKRLQIHALKLVDDPALHGCAEDLRPTFSINDFGHLVTIFYRRLQTLRYIISIIFWFALVPILPKIRLLSRSG